MPSTEGFVQAVLAGMGWGMISDLQLADPKLRSAVALLDEHDTVDIPLYWQRWKVRSPSLDLLSDTVLATGRQALQQH